MKISTAELLQTITNYKLEISEMQKLLGAILSRDDDKISKEDISEMVNNIDEKIQLIYDFQIELIERNYSSDLEFEGKQYKLIEILKIKEKIFQEQEILNIIINSDIANSKNKDMLNLSLETFQELQLNRKRFYNIKKVIANHNKGNTNDIK